MRDLPEPVPPGPVSDIPWGHNVTLLERLADSTVRFWYARIVGIIMCRSKNKLVAEYALRDVRKPIGVSAFRLTRALPERLRGTLPTVGDLEREFRGPRGKRDDADFRIHPRGRARA